MTFARMDSSSASCPFPQLTRETRVPRSADRASGSIWPPILSTPSRSSFSALPSAVPPQPTDRATSAVSFPSSAALSRAIAPGPPFFPFRPGRGSRAAGLTVREDPAQSADLLVHLRELVAQVPEPLVLRYLPPDFVQLGTGFQVQRQRPAARPARQVPLRPVPPVTRRRARAIRLPALAEHRAQRPPPEITHLRELREHAIAP